MKIKTWRRRLLSLAMCLSLALVLLPTGVLADTDGTLLLNGEVVENCHSIAAGGTYTLQNAPDSDGQNVQLNVFPKDGKTVYLTLDSVKMGELMIGENATVEITLKGMNTLCNCIKLWDNSKVTLNLEDGSQTTVAANSSNNNAAINVLDGASLTVNGDTGILTAEGHCYAGDSFGGKLYAYPGIGVSESGTLTVNGGHVTASSGEGTAPSGEHLVSAAIGGQAQNGASYSASGSIVINGGTVIANGTATDDGVAIGDNAGPSASKVTIGKDAVVLTTGTYTVKAQSVVNNGVLAGAGKVVPEASGSGKRCEVIGADAGSGLDLTNAPTTATYYTAGSGYAIWEPVLADGKVSSGTLTLHDTAIGGAGDPMIFVGVDLPSVPVTVEMQGTNTITGGNKSNNCGIRCNGDTTIDLAAGSRTTILAEKAQNNYGIFSSNAALTVQGSGALTINTYSQENSYGIYVNAPVRLLGGTLSITAEGNQASGVYSGKVTLGGITVPADGTLALTETSGVTQTADTTVVNNGELVLPASAKITDLKLAGTGFVKIDAGKTDENGTEIFDTYANDGTKKVAVEGNVTFADASETAEGYTYTVDAAKDTAALVLKDNTLFTGSMTLPSDRDVTISGVGTAAITGTIEVPNARNLTISGIALNVGGINDAAGAPTVTVENGAKVVSGGISVSGGTLKITGSGTTLAAAGDSYGGAALQAGNILLSGGAVVSASSTDNGPALRAVNGDVSVTGGAKLTTHCAYGVYVKNGTFTVDRSSTFTDTGATVAAVCVDNSAAGCLRLANLPAGNQIASVAGISGTYWSVVSDGNTLGLAAEGDPVTLSNAVKSLTLKDAGSDVVTPATYTLTASAGDNGAISPSGAVAVTAGDSKTFTITPAQGYGVADVLVDGKSVGAVTTYTFEKIAANHTISAVFSKNSPYGDVKNDDWFRDDVAYVTEHQLMNGTGNGNFSPNASMTRAMIVTVLWRLAGSPSMEDYGYPYGDVNARTSVYAPAIYWARAQNVVKGYSDDKFGPNDPITREQLAAMLYRYAGLKKYDVTGAADLSAYADVSTVSRYAKPAVAWAVSAKLMQGSANRLNAKGLATRAQVAAVLTRFCQNLVK